MKQHILYFATPEALQAAQPEPLEFGQALFIQVYLTDDSTKWQAPLRHFLQHHYPMACVTGITCYGQFQHEQYYRSGLLLQLIGFDNTRLNQCVLSDELDEASIMDKMSALLTP